MKRFLSAFILFAACSLMAQPQAILRNAMTTNIAGTPVLSRADLSVTNVGSGTNWLFYGTSPRTVARLVDIALGAGTLWATIVSNSDGSVTVYTNTANVGTNIYGLSSATFVNYASNALQTSMSNTVGYVSNILNTGIVSSSNLAHLDLTNLVVAVSNSIHVDITNLNVVTSNALQTSMSNTVDYVSNVLAQGAIAGSNQMHLDLTNLTVLVSNATHVDMTNLVNASSNNFKIKTNMIAGVPTTTYVAYIQADGAVVWTNIAAGSGAQWATVVSNANGTVTVYTNSSVTGTNIYGLAVADPLTLTTMNVQDFTFTNVTGTFTNANNFGTNKPGVAGQFLTSDGGYLYWSTIDQSFGQAWFVWGSSNTLATNSSGVAYKAMQKSDVTLPATPNTNTYTTPTAGQYVGEVITAIPAGVTAILPGDIDTVSFIYLSENRTMVLQPEIYLRTNMIAPSWSALGELEIGAGPQFTVNNVFTPYTIAVTITTNVPMSVTNYLVRKYKVISVSGGTPNALFVSQGQYPARVTFPIGSSSFVLKSGDTMSGNLVVNASIGINTNTTASAFHVLANTSQTNLIVAGLTTGDYKFVVSTNGDIMVNFNSVPAELSLIGTAISARGADNAQVRLAYSSYGAAGLGAFAGRHARGTAGSKSPVQAGDVLVSLEGWGYGATAYSASPRAFIRGYAGGTWTDSTQPAYIALWTCDAGGIVPVERIRINTNGTVGFATNSPQEVLHVNGSGRFQTNVVTMWDGAHYGLSALTNYAGETFASTNAITGQVQQSSNNFVVKTNMITGIPTTAYVPTIQSGGTIQWAAATGLPSGSPGFSLCVNPSDNSAFWHDDSQWMNIVDSFYPQTSASVTTKGGTMGGLATIGGFVLSSRTGRNHFLTFTDLPCTNNAYASLKYNSAATTGILWSNIYIEASVYFQTAFTNAIYRVGAGSSAMTSSATCTNDTDFIFWEWDPYRTNQWVAVTGVGSAKTYVYTNEAPIALANWYRVGFYGNTNSIVFTTNGVPCATNSTASTMPSFAPMYFGIRASSQKQRDFGDPDVLDRFASDWIRIMEY